MKGASGWTCPLEAFGFLCSWQRELHSAWMGFSSTSNQLRGLLGKKRRKKKKLRDTDIFLTTLRQVMYNELTNTWIDSDFDFPGLVWSDESGCVAGWTVRSHVFTIPPPSRQFRGGTCMACRSLVLSARVTKRTHPCIISQQTAQRHFTLAHINCV